MYRFDAARPWLEGKSVLDIGAARSFKTLHKLIREAASETLAIDLDAATVRAMIAAGVPAVVGDAQQFDLGRRFDVIFAGELIEHLDDYRGFFSAVRAHLNPDGRLILTTPNAFRFMNFVYRLGRTPAPVNTDHMVWFCETTLTQLMERNRFEILHMGYVGHKTAGRLRAAVAAPIRRLLPPRLAYSTLFAVARALDGHGVAGPDG